MYGLMAKTVKRPSKAVSKKPKVVHPYLVRFGTRKEMGEPRSFSTEKQARDEIHKQIDTFKTWCIRHNGAGLKQIEAFKEDLSRATFHVKPARLQCCFDELYGMYFVAEFWTTR